MTAFLSVPRISCPIFDPSTHLSVVDPHDAANHLGYDNHITQMCLDDCGLLIGGSLLLSLAQLFDEAHGPALKTALEATAGTGMNELLAASWSNLHSLTKSLK